jgi:hypothetical protein
MVGIVWSTSCFALCSVNVRLNLLTHRLYRLPDVSEPSYRMRHTRRRTIFPTLLYANSKRKVKVRQPLSTALSLPSAGPLVLTTTTIRLPIRGRLVRAQVHGVANQLRWLPQSLHPLLDYLRLPATMISRRVSSTRVKLRICLHPYWHCLQRNKHGRSTIPTTRLFQLPSDLCNLRNLASPNHRLETTRHVLHQRLSQRTRTRSLLFLLTRDERRRPLTKERRNSVLTIWTLMARWT